MARDAINWYLYQYPQLTLPVREGMSGDERYLDIVRRGILPDSEMRSDFIGTDEDERQMIPTPVGPMQVLYLANREDFERFVRVFAGRCEPITVPRNTGAITFFNVSNWRKILAHKLDYITAGGDNWTEEFKRFTADPANYKDKIILLSKGYYSRLPAEESGWEPDEWLRRSRTIRTYHEATHVVSRTLFIENREAVRDEVVADCIGLVAATGNYDPLLASKFLGVENEEYRPGGRLENYVEQGNSIAEEAKRARRIVSELDTACSRARGTRPFDLLQIIEKERVGIGN